MKSNGRCLTEATVIGLAVFALSGAVAGAEPEASAAPEQAEAGAGGERPGRSRFDAVDTDTNGAVSKAEADGAGLSKNWGGMDADKNGEISRAEFSTFEDNNVSRKETKELRQNNKGQVEPIDSWFESPQHDPSKKTE